MSNTRQRLATLPPKVQLTVFVAIAVLLITIQHRDCSNQITITPEATVFKEAGTEALEPAGHCLQSSVLTESTNITQNIIFRHDMNVELEDHQYYGSANYSCPALQATFSGSSRGSANLAKESR